MMHSKYRDFIIPVAILAAGVILAITVYYVRVHQELAKLPQGDPSQARAVSPDDHIVGSPTAPVILIEYADIDGPYSKQFQQTMEQLMIDYAAGGKVAWVFRHLPLPSEHVNDETHAEAAECAASLGTSSTFFHFIDLLQAQAPSGTDADPSAYDGVIAQLGIDTTKFKQCLANFTFSKHVQSDYTNGIIAGAKGSPYSILLVQGQKPEPISGAIPYDTMKQIIDSAIAKVK